MAAELEFITRHISNLKVIQLGVSQGAAFTNAVMQQLQGLRRIYSIELGMFFWHRPRRVITGRTLAIDSNGVVPDAAVQGAILAGIRAYLAAPFRWLGYRLMGKPVKFSHCINVRGHNYDWHYPRLQQEIVDFLKLNFSRSNG